MPMGRPRRPLRSPITSPTVSSGTTIATVRMGSSSTGEAFAMACLKAIEPAILNAISDESTSGRSRRRGERARRADRVVGHGPVLHGLVDPLLHRGDEALGDHPALDLVLELEAPAGRQRLDLDVAIAELAAAARLLLVAALGLGLALDGLHVGDAWGFQVDLRPKRSFIRPDHLDVHLGQAGHDELARARIAVDIDGGVLVLQPAQRRAHLLLVAPRLGLDRKGHDRRRQE